MPAEAALSDSFLPAVAGPLDIDALSWRFPLLPYQRAGVHRLVTDRPVLLADEMGLGKTIQAIAALRLLLRDPEMLPALIVVPSGLVLQWRRQLRDWAPELTLATCTGGRAERLARWRAAARVYLTSYDALVADMTLPAPAGPLRRLWGVVVLDEAQRIKNASTLVASVVKSLPRQRGWALTGTPLENRPEDTVSILEFVAPGMGDPRQAPGGCSGGSPARVPGRMPGEMMFGLRRLLGQVQLRRRRAEVLPDLPPRTGFELACELGSRQRIAYQRAEQAGLVWLKSLGATVRITHVLELILRLKQLCNICPWSGESAKLEDLCRRVSEIAPGEKILVFSQFVADPFGAEMIARALAPLRPVLLTGRMTQAARDAAVAAFSRDPAHRVLVSSLRAGGMGLNLTTASVVFHFDRWWNPAVEAQAEDRVYRIGQTRPVQVFAYLTPGTIEERIAAILAEKRALFADLIDGVGTEALRRLDLPTLLRAVGVNPPLSKLD